MRILNTYIARELVITVLLAIGVLTFVMTAGHIIRVFDWLSRGGSPGLLGHFLLLRLPGILCFTLPLSLLCATVLVFSHLSADNEVTAMKACGISLWQIISPALLLSVLMSAICFWLSTTVAPRCLYAADGLLWKGASVSPAMLLEGSENFIELSNMDIRVERHDQDRLYGVHILILDKDGRLRRTITAREGQLEPDPDSGDFRLVLTDATFGTVNLDRRPDNAADDEETPERLAMERIVLPLKLMSGGKVKRLYRKLKHMDLRMLLGRIFLETEVGGNITPLLVELHTRMSMSLSPIAFLLLGIPFAIRGRRSETSVGLLVSLLLALGFYAFMLLTRTLRNQPQLHPEVLVWIPNVLYQIGGLVALAIVGKH